MEQGLKEKISLFCNVERPCVIEEKDVEHSIYEVPLELHAQGLDALICSKLGLEARPVDIGPWQDLVERIKAPKAELEIAVVGKYIGLHDAYKSIYEALSHGGYASDVKVRFRKISPEELTRANVGAALAGARGLLVPGGFGERGFRGKMEAIRHARENGLPFFGICLGLQAAVTEFARHVCGIEDANSAEWGEPCTPVIDMMEEQKKVKQLGGTMRLGAFPCRLAAGTRARAAYGTETIHERHRHRYEVNNAYRSRLVSKGLVIAGLNEALDLVEVVELPDHPWFVAVQYHPEFQSKPTAPHPLFRDFVRAASG